DAGQDDQHDRRYYGREVRCDVPERRAVERLQAIVLSHAYSVHAQHLQCCQGAGSAVLWDHRGQCQSEHEGQELSVTIWWQRGLYASGERGLQKSERSEPLPVM